MTRYSEVVKSATKPTECEEVVIFVEKLIVYIVEETCLAKYNKKWDFFTSYY